MMPIIRNEGVGENKSKCNNVFYTMIIWIQRQIGFRNLRLMKWDLVTISLFLHIQSLSVWYNSMVAWFGLALIVRWEFDNHGALLPALLVNLFSNVLGNF